MPLKLITNFVTSFIKRNNESIDSSSKEIAASQKSSSLVSISFSPTLTIQGLWSKKDDQSDIATIKSSAEIERWTAHQEQLIHWHNQPPIFDPYPSWGIQDYELIETLGEFFITSTGQSINVIFLRYWYLWSCLVSKAEKNKKVLCDQSIKKGGYSEIEASRAH
jgi:hypothetical protein